jgi:AraC-like DNA-binding protein
LQGVARAEQAFFYAFQGLLRGDLSWREVALQSGFADQSHLCRETRRFSGFSPDEIKNGMLQDEAFWIYRLWSSAF